LRALVIACLAGACGPHYDNGKLKCENGKLCPMGFHCAMDDTCWRDGEDPDLAVSSLDLSNTSDDGFIGDGATDLSEGAIDLSTDDVPRAIHSSDMAGQHITLTFSLSKNQVHSGATVIASAHLSGLQPGDTGSVTFTASFGGYTNVSCTPPSNGTADCSASYLAGSPGTIDLGAVSSDDGSSDGAQLGIVAPVTLQLDRTTVDLVVFGPSPPRASVTATLSNLLPGDANTVTLLGSPPSSFTASAGGTQIAIIPAAVTFPATTVPVGASLLVAPTANQSAAVTLTVQLHAWLDHSAEVAQLFLNQEVELYTVAIEPQSGKVLVGGRALSPSPHPVAGLYTPGSGWQIALPGYNGADGAITSAVAAVSGEFLIAGITGPKDGYLNASLLQIHCNVGGALCQGLSNQASVQMATAPVSDGKWATQVVPGPDAPFSASPIIGLQGNTKYLAFTTHGDGQCVADNSVATILSASSLDATAWSTISWKTQNATDDPANSCPLESGTEGILTGMAIDSLGTMWVGGYDQCTVTAACVDFEGTPNFTGMMRRSSSGAWLNMIGTTTATGLDGVRMRRGYDDSMLMIGTMSGSNPISALRTFAPGDPTLWNRTFTLPAYAISPAAFGHAIAGSVTGGAPWAGTNPDIWFSYATSGGGRYRLAWLPSPGITVMVFIDGNSNDRALLDLAFANTNSGVQGWVVGINSGGGPFVAQLH
jgi:hypothetical protein